METNLPSLLVSIKEGVIDLGWGHPSARLHPLEQIKAASERMLAVDNRGFLQYGATQGFGPFLESLSSFLSGQPAYGVSVDPRQLFLTAGASQGLDMACTLFAQSGDVVVVEEPTYFVIEEVFRDRKLNVVGVPMDSQGLIVADLEEKLRGGLRPKLVYTIPTFQNPTGISMESARKAQLVSLANEYDFRILADEVYQFIHFESLPPSPFMAFDQGDRVISFGSFSKILAPGLRAGWVHASPEIVQRFSNAALTFSGGGFSQYTSALIREVIDLGLLDKNIDTLREEYASRAVAMHRALHCAFLGEIECRIPSGGFYLWLTFPDGFDSDELLPLAERAGVSYRPGNAFSESRRFSRNLRLAYSLYETGELEEGVSRLAMAYRES